MAVQNHRPAAHYRNSALASLSAIRRSGKSRGSLAKLLTDYENFSRPRRTRELPVPATNCLVVFDQTNGCGEPPVRCAGSVRRRLSLTQVYDLDGHACPPRSGSGPAGGSVFGVQDRIYTTESPGSGATREPWYPECRSRARLRRHPHVDRTEIAAVLVYRTRETDASNQGSELFRFWVLRQRGHRAPHRRGAGGASGIAHGGRGPLHGTLPPSEAERHTKPSAQINQRRMPSCEHVGPHTEPRNRRRRGEIRGGAEKARLRHLWETGEVRSLHPWRRLQQSLQLDWASPSHRRLATCVPQRPSAQHFRPLRGG
jgi:hypothetical protein